MCGYCNSFLHLKNKTRAHLGFDLSNVFNRYSIIYLRIYLKINCKE